MGRKSNTKGKEKRLARKEEQRLLSAARASVAAANALPDPMEPFPVFRRYAKNGIECNLHVKRVTDLDDRVVDWAFQLTKRNMQTKYENSQWGWCDNRKREELTDDASWFLIAESIDGTPIGFSHFRFDIDENMEVLYVYELQLEFTVLRRGLGKFMMQILELIAWKNNMRKVILTVLKNNSFSTFFKAINYQLDESSPIDDEDEIYTYQILSKINRKLLDSTESLISQKIMNNVHTTTAAGSPYMMMAHHNNHSHAHAHAHAMCCSNPAAAAAALQAGGGGGGGGAHAHHDVTCGGTTGGHHHHHHCHHH